MSRPIILYSGGWTDIPLEEFVPHVAEWGYQGVDLCCWGDHFEVQRAAGEDGARDVVVRVEREHGLVGAGGEIDDRLEVQLEVAAFEGDAQLIGDGDAIVSDLAWPDDARLGGKLVGSLRVKDRKSGLYRKRQIWWLELDPSASERPEHPFPFVTGPCESAVFWRGRELVQRLEALAIAPLEPLWADVTSLLGIVTEVVGGGAGCRTVACDSGVISRRT